MPGESVPLRERAARDPLCTRIRSGLLSGALPWLQTSAHRLVTVAGDAVVLRGLDLPPLELPPTGAAGRSLARALTSRLDAALDWGATIVRLPIARSIVLDEIDAARAAAYLAAIDEMIAAAAGGGAYTLLSAVPDAPATQEVAPLGGIPGTDASIGASIRLWQILSARYSEEPAVLFDLLAPLPAHAPEAGDLASAWVRRQLQVRWLVALLRVAHPRAVSLVAGLDSGRDLSGFPVLGRDGTPIPNVVYAAHLRAGDGAPLRRLTEFSRRAPLLVTGWETDARPGPASDVTTQTLAAAGVGWVTTCANGGGFLRELRGRQEPTSAGREAQRRLALARVWDHQG